jgi:hypothetical protein
MARNETADIANARSGLKIGNASKATARIAPLRDTAPAAQGLAAAANAQAPRPRK